MQAVILAGGFGTRLAHVVKDVPKPMAPINDLPFLDYLYHQLLKQGFDDFLLLTGYKSEIIENYFKNYDHVRCLRETTPLGTAGALLNALDFLDDQFLLLNGDTFFDADYSLLYEYKRKYISTPSILMALRFSDDFNRYGFVEFDENYNVYGFTEKGNLPAYQIDGFINAGAYLIDKGILDRYRSSNNILPLSLEIDLFPMFIQDQILKALPLGGFFIDIGIPEDYERAQKLIPLTISNTKKPTLFIDKDGTLIEDTGYVHGKNIVPIESTLELVKSYHEKGYLIVIISNQAGIAKNKFKEQDLLDNIAAVQKYYSVHGIKFDGVEVCSYCEDAVLEEYKFKSYARKPQPGMILRACEKLPIDLTKSVMIGDNCQVDRILLPYLHSMIIE